MSYLSQILRRGDALERKRVVEQVGGLCHRANAFGVAEVLLITTRQTKRWTIPKGWPIKGLDPHQAAKQEAWEEAGVKGRVKKKAFGSFTYDKVLANGETVPALVQVHLLETRRVSFAFPERGERALIWLPADEASHLVSELGLKKLLAKFARRAASAAS